MARDRSESPGGWAFVKAGEAWAEDAAAAASSVQDGAAVCRAFGEVADGVAVVGEWILGPLPGTGLPTQHAGAGLLRHENWTGALRFFHQSVRRTDPAGLAAVRGGLELASFGVADLQAAIGRGEAAAYSDKQRGVQGLAVFGPGGPGGAAILRYFDGSAAAAGPLLAFVARAAAARGRAGVHVCVPAEQARWLQALVPAWEPDRLQVVAAPPETQAAVPAERP